MHSLYIVMLEHFHEAKHNFIGFAILVQSHTCVVNVHLSTGGWAMLSHVSRAVLFPSDVFLYFMQPNTLRLGSRFVLCNQTRL